MSDERGAMNGRMTQETAILDQPASGRSPARTGIRWDARPSLRDLYPNKAPALTAFGYTAVHLGLIVLMAWACERAFLLGWTAFVPVYALGLFVIGSRFRALGNMLHEASHGTLS